MANHTPPPWTDQPQPNSAVVEILADVDGERLVIARAYGYKPFRVGNMPPKIEAVARDEWKRAHGIACAYAAREARSNARLIAVAPNLDKAVQILLTNAILAPNPRMEGLTDCYLVPTDDIEALRAVMEKA